MSDLTSAAYGTSASTRWTALGRFLLVAGVTGTVVGGVLAGSYAVIGAMVGCVLALVIQLVNLAAVGLALKVRPGLPERWLLLPIPAVSVGALISGLLLDGASAPRAIAALTVTVGATIAVAWLTAPWCLAPTAKKP
ncbi:hypothetical protein [Kineosporia babensis]|uniref:Uncharacterized protein n=1 Tax=Kineosporia babensis TaxID=499548 RepID=A0A9X1SW59_9ACTN|nr:hypothetical protein [Kineosporia babensis]MCD5313600.1 hypothetical protein [Kineosporia babensis]